MFELSFEKLIVIGLIAAFLIGPERLPAYATQLARLVRVLRGMASEAKGRLEEELGADVDVDWRRLDPRQYDPRRIVREALLDDGDDDRDGTPGRESRSHPGPGVDDPAFEPAEDDDGPVVPFDPDPSSGPAARAARRMTVPAVDDEAT